MALREDYPDGYVFHGDDINATNIAVNATAPIKALTLAEYNALSASEQNNGTVYLVQGDT